MAHTNSTTNYHLPQFTSTDKPAWLTDVNAAYSDIDTGMKNAQDAADSAQGDATQALLDASSAMSTATSADSKASGAIASLGNAFSDTSTYSVDDYVVYNNILYKCIVAVTVPGPWSGTLNWERASVGSVADDLKNDINSVDDNLRNVINSLTATDIDYDTNTTVADKLNSLTTSVNTVNIHPANFTHASITQGNIYSYSIGKIYMISGYMQANAQIPSDTVIGNVSGITLHNEIFGSSIGSNGTGLRFLNYTDGRFRIERAMPANEWFSFTLIGFLA